MPPRCARRLLGKLKVGSGGFRNCPNEVPRIMFSFVAPGLVPSYMSELPAWAPTSPKMVPRWLKDGIALQDQHYHNSLALASVRVEGSRCV